MSNLFLGFDCKISYELPEFFGGFREPGKIGVIVEYDMIAWMGHWGLVWNDFSDGYCSV